MMTTEAAKALEPAERSSSSPDPQGLQGLSAVEASMRLSAEGPNELPQESRRGVFAIALEVVRQPMFLMLVAAGGLYLAIGDPADALMLLGLGAFARSGRGFSRMRRRSAGHSPSAG